MGRGEFVLRIELRALPVEPRRVQRRLFLRQLRGEIRTFEYCERLALVNQISRMHLQCHATGSRRVQRRTHRCDHLAVSRDVAHNVNAIRPYLGFAGISDRAPLFTSNYNSLQVTMSHHSHGLTVGIAYTWSKALTTSSGDRANGAFAARTRGVQILKGGEAWQHLIPLSEQAMELLRGLMVDGKPVGEYLFPSPRPRRSGEMHLGNSAMLDLLERLKWNDRTTTHTTTTGASLQATNTDQLFGHNNHFVVGGSFDRSVTNFTVLVGANDAFHWQSFAEPAAPAPTSAPTADLICAGVSSEQASAGAAADRGAATPDAKIRRKATAAVSLGTGSLRVRNLETRRRSDGIEPAARR